MSRFMADEMQRSYKSQLFPTFGFEQIRVTPSAAIRSGTRNDVGLNSIVLNSSIEVPL